MAPAADELAAKSAPSAAATLTTSMEVLDDERPLGKGDRVSLRIVEDRKPPVELVVTDSGDLEVPLIGRVPARGRSCKALAFAVKASLEKDYFYRCTVIVGLDAASSRSRGKIYLSGQLKAQGFIEIPPEETLTVSRAILRSGGFGDFANKRKVKVVRKTGSGKKDVYIVDVLQILEKGDISGDLALEPDDLVMVPERLINF